MPTQDQLFQNFLKEKQGTKPVTATPTTGSKPLIGPILTPSRPTVSVPVSASTAGTNPPIGPPAPNSGGSSGPSGAMNADGTPYSWSTGTGGAIPHMGGMGTTPIKQAMQQMPTYIPPAPTGLNFDQAKGQVSGQIDPMFARALEALQAQKRQDQLNGSELGSARGGAHSGLAADLQNKVGIAAAGKASDLDATRQTQIAEMAQDLVKYGQDYDLRSRQAGLAEYLGLNQLDLQRQGQNADYSGMFQGMQTMQSKNADRGYGLDLAGLSGQLPSNLGGGQTMQAKSLAFDQGMQNRQMNNQEQSTAFNQGMQTKQFDYNVAIDSRDFDYKKAQDSWSNAFAKEQYNDQKAARIWEQTFKTKSFEQDMKDAASARGLQWASLNQRDKEFIADSTYREKTFKANQDQQTLDNTFRTDQAKVDADAKLLPKPPSATEIKNNTFAEYTSAMDGLDKKERKAAIAAEKNQLIKELGPTGYNQFYDLYFDKHGNPK